MLSGVVAGPHEQTDTPTIDAIEVARRLLSVERQLAHEGRVELHFCTPRLDLSSGRSLNIAPPGYQTAFDSFRDLMNQAHGWADLMETHRAQEVQPVLETPQRAKTREEVHAWILDEISVGTITDRASMVALMTDVGFTVLRAG